MAERVVTNYVPSARDSRSDLSALSDELSNHEECCSDSVLLQNIKQRKCAEVIRPVVES
jgi:hypothetical protein